MAPVKFEENIREKLEEREIKPSKDAWKKLSTQLDALPKKSNNRTIWYAIAASLIGVLIVVSVVRNISSNASEEINKELVNVDASEETPMETSPKIKLNEQILKEESKEMVASETVSEEKKIEKIVETPQKTFQKKDRIAVQKTAKKNNSDEPIKANNSVKIEPIEAVAVNQLNSEEKILNDKIQKVVAQVEQLQKENTVVTAEEIDALLINAQREIRTQQILSSNKVDAASLLDDVETELERSFRDKVYDALGEGFTKIRTAVIERNN
ncbi:hypothetical protein [Ulvibacter antarcticus]|uniref:Uncharacterized protein n=1 Tax=Ulvibacter antarcticus TaxID=442714 RepID=A0A3L9YIC6_9FLAO|nr:hypothetical protein [Ulvibacter antarcticus]RMA57678.1 hypothetical protein BXY75_2482 [Ulvibacter antarcticus]